MGSFSPGQSPGLRRKVTVLWRVTQIVSYSKCAFPFIFRLGGELGTGVLREQNGEVHNGFLFNHPVSEW